MSFLTPRSIAVIGASATPGKVGHDILQNLLTQGYGGRVFPVNPKHDRILDTKTYATVHDLPETPDLAIIVIPAPLVPDALRACGEKGIPSVAIISAGFKETGTADGKHLEETVTSIAAEYNLSILGPNCLGVLRPTTNMNASFAKDLPPAGGIGLISQSGAFAVALMDASPHLHMGMSAVLSIGNKAVTDETDLLVLLADDPETRVIGLYLENVQDGRRFLEGAARIVPRKPVVLLKAGVSTLGTRAAASHTGALAGSDSAIDALCLQSGIHRAHTLEEFVDLLRTLDTQPPLLSDRIAIVTNAGGPGILAADAAEKAGLTLPTLEKRQLDALRKALPAAAATGNPFDVVGDADAERYKAAIDACIHDPNIDGIVAILTPQVMTPVDAIAAMLIDARKRAPLMPMVTGFLGKNTVDAAIATLAHAGIPNMRSPEGAVGAMAALRTQDVRTSNPPPIDPQRQTQAAQMLEDKEGLLDENTTAALFALYDLPTPKQRVAQSASDAVAAATAIGFPVVLKVSSPDIAHKSDVGGIRIGLADSEAVQQAYADIEATVRKHAPEARWTGVLVQQQLLPGDEFIVGGLRDPAFGPLVMTGLGGIYTELFRDTAFRIAPISTEEATTMLTQLQSWKLLLGMRGAEQRDIAALARCIANVSLLLAECPQITELDGNPVIVSDTEVTIADAKVMLTKPKTDHR